MIVDETALTENIFSKYDHFDLPSLTILNFLTQSVDIELAKGIKKIEFIMFCFQCISVIISGQTIKSENSRKNSEFFFRENIFDKAFILMQKQSLRSNQ